MCVLGGKDMCDIIASLFIGTTILSFTSEDYRSLYITEKKVLYNTYVQYLYMFNPDVPCDLLL